MELRVVLRGAVSGFIAGIFGFAFARIFAEPYIQQAIDYESGRVDALAAVAKAQGVELDPDGPELFSRTIQSTAGLATGIIGLSTVLGAVVAVAYLVLHSRFRVRPRTLALLVAGFGFLGVYLVPFVKYPANPPAIGHDFTIGTRTQLYLTMVVASLLLLGMAAFVGCQLRRFGVFNAVLIAAGGFIVLISVLMLLLPSLGELGANKAVAHSLGYGSSGTETPLPVTDPQGRLVYPGFPADVLWKFRLYSVIAQLIIWATIGLIFSFLLERMFRRSGSAPAPVSAPETVAS